MALDDEEKLDAMCSKCSDKAQDKSKCSVCGINIDEEFKIDNPKFDKDKFAQLEEDDGNANEKFDRSKFKLRSE